MRHLVRPKAALIIEVAKETKKRWKLAVPRFPIIRAA